RKQTPMTDRDDIARIRIDYAKARLGPEDCLTDPLAQFNRWLDEAITSQVNEPTAMNLATVENGRPSARMVLLKGIESGAFVFYTNYLSRKGTQLQDNPFAALTLFWPELERQVRVEGRVERVSGEASDTYFASRP